MDFMQIYTASVLSADCHKHTNTHTHVKPSSLDAEFLSIPALKFARIRLNFNRYLPSYMMCSARCFRNNRI